MESNNLPKISDKQLIVLGRAILKYGSIPQIDQAVEECAELIQAINKCKRKGGFERPNKKNHQSYCQAYWNLCSEVADVKIMIAQLELMLDEEAIQLSIDRKVERLNDRLNLQP
jgi:NTP pyrophosphatase (non-canonical NTP hydrolase)